MSELAIRVEKLSKRYRIGARQHPLGTLRERLGEMLLSPFEYLRTTLRPPTEEEIIWALKDVSFEVKRGEVVGVIGRNGAGKSTLLKILSRITEPTSGYADLYGRVGSLLEVGTGFHPELTGRENVYMNGAILGMRKAEIDRKFDEIVEFAGVEKFIDTPVKRYSSGMYVRLAFAVAAHLETEILLVDEVLAVGDAEFQKKCLGKMGDVAKEGRTVLFVSHNMGAIKSLCPRAILVNNGAITKDSNVHEVVDTYLAKGAISAEPGVIPTEASRLHSTGEAVFRSINIVNSFSEKTTKLYLGEPFQITLSLEVLKPIEEAAIEITILSADGIEVASARTLDGDNLPIRLPTGNHEITVDLTVFLLPRDYSIMLIVHKIDGAVIDWVERAFDFSVLNVSRENADTYRYYPIMRGYVRAPSHWRFSEKIDFHSPVINR